MSLMLCVIKPVVAEKKFHSDGAGTLGEPW